VVTEHEDVRALLPELAVHAADGDDRAIALEHLTGCPACRAELAQLAQLMDDVLLLAPAVPAPPGFAETVVARLQADQRPPAPRPSGRPDAAPRPPAAPAPRRRWPATVVAVSAALLVALGAGALTGAAVWRHTAGDRELAAGYRQTLPVAHGHDLQAARLQGPDGSEVGTVFAYQGEPSWLYVTFRSPPRAGRYDVALVTADGRRLPLRAFTATAASTGWGSTVAVDIDQIRTLRFAGGALPELTASFA
jgi:hypothetical protein